MDLRSVLTFFLILSCGKVTLIDDEPWPGAIFICFCLASEVLAYIFVIKLCYNKNELRAQVNSKGTPFCCQLTTTRRDRTTQKSSTRGHLYLLLGEKQLLVFHLLYIREGITDREREREVPKEIS